MSLTKALSTETKKEAKREAKKEVTTKPAKPANNLTKARKLAHKESVAKRALALTLNPPQKVQKQAPPQITLAQIRERTRATNLTAERYTLDRILWEEACASATHDGGSVPPQRLMRAVKNSTETDRMRENREEWEARMDALMPEYKTAVTDRVTANRAAKLAKKARRLATAQGVVDAEYANSQNKGEEEDEFNEEADLDSKNPVARHMRPTVIQRRALKSFLAEERRAERCAAMYAKDALIGDSAHVDEDAVVVVAEAVKNGKKVAKVVESGLSAVDVVAPAPSKRSKKRAAVVDAVVEEAEEVVVAEKKVKKAKKIKTVA